jgi:sulfite reductase (NADPH) flavoprotein alpha-component
VSRMATMVLPPSRKSSSLGRLTVNRRLTDKSFWKEARHLEISLEEGGLQYEVGDSVGVLPTNDPQLVERILRVLEFSGTESVRTSDGTTVSLQQALLGEYTLTKPSKPLLSAIARRDPSAAFLEDLLDPDATMKLDRYLFGKDILDFLEKFRSIRFSSEEFIGFLRKLQPRLYSIASSQKVYPYSIHLTVSVVRYSSCDRLRRGVCSTFLAERAAVIPLFIHSARHFHMPKDPGVPIIMVGPGTGIAPFRAFLQERRAIGARGKNWLFFGGRRYASDFFYQNELEAYCTEGMLHRLDAVFSRDQELKIYVQHRMLEKAKEFYHWLESGAYLYVCGDAAHMAKEVEKTLHVIVEKAGNKTSDQSEEYVKKLKSERRYRCDVY